MHKLSKALLSTSNHKPIYLDYQASTPVDPRVLEQMMPYFTTLHANPHSNHPYGKSCSDAIENARSHIASLIHAETKDIVFTCGATESNNHAIKGVAAMFRSQKQKHIITCCTEHKCIIESCKSLQQEGFEVTYLPVKSNGIISLDDFKASIKPYTFLASFMGVNNEIGILQPLAEIGKICREKGIYLHSDAAQALGKINLDVNAMNLDLVSMTAHKMYGPKGIGALYVRRNPKVRISPLLHGGGQERGIRSGTLSPALAVGFGEACRLGKEDFEKDNIRIKDLSHKLKSRIFGGLSNVFLNGDENIRFAGNINVSVKGVEASDLMAGLEGIAVSSGSACNSSCAEPSYVLMALGFGFERAQSSIRIGIGKYTTDEEIDIVCNKFIHTVNLLRAKNKN